MSKLPTFLNYIIKINSTDGSFTKGLVEFNNINDYAIQ